MTAIIPAGTVAWGLQLPDPGPEHDLRRAVGGDGRRRRPRGRGAGRRPGGRAVRRRVRARRHPQAVRREDGHDLVPPVRHAGVPGRGDRRRCGCSATCSPCRTTTPSRWPRRSPRSTRLSGGRAIVGVGAGHVEPEFALLGVDFAGRGALGRAVAAGDPGRPRRRVPGAARRRLGPRRLGGAVAPRPVQASVPIWVGGSSPVAVRRAAQYGDGWLPQGVRPRDLPGVVERIRRLRAEAGRPERFDVGALRRLLRRHPDLGRRPHLRGRAGRDRWPSCGRWVEAGADQLQVRFRSRDRAELVDQIERFGAEVAPNL